MKMQQSDPRRDTRSRVLELHRQGLKVTAIAAQIGVTPARVYQHLADLREKGEIK